MSTLVEFIKHRLIALSIILALAVTGIETETPPWLDFLLNLALLALIFAFTSRRPR